MDEFEKKFKEIDVGLGLSMEEQYRVYARDCFNFGPCKIKKKKKKSDSDIYGSVHPANDIDLAGTCPDAQSGSPWNFRDDRDVTIKKGQVIILDKESVLK